MRDRMNNREKAFLSILICFLSIYALCFLLTVNNQGCFFKIIESATRFVGNEKSVNSESVERKANVNVGIIDEAKEMGEQIVIALQDEKYSFLYSMCSENLKLKGTQNEFSNYVAYANIKYGPLIKTRLTETTISDDVNEVQLKYEYISAEHNNSVSILIWVRPNEKQYLSGIRFIENTW